MKTRKFGKTGKQVSELGFGAWQLGNTNSGEWGDPDQDPIRLVHAAMDMGVNFFDTAPNYGGGASTHFLGKALSGRRHQAVINSKFGHSAKGTSFAVADLRPSVEESLKILNTDYIDSLLLHNPEMALCSGDHPIYEELEKLQQEGKILSYGASLDDSESLSKIIETTKSSTIMPLYNINFQECASVFPKAAEEHYGIIVKVPLDSGWLSGKYSSSSSFHDIRSRWSSDVIKRRDALNKKLEDILDGKMTILQAALSFILARPEVSTVIPGIKNEAQLKSNIQAAQTPMAKTLVTELEAYYRSEIAPDPLPW